MNFGNPARPLNAAQLALLINDLTQQWGQPPPADWQQRMALMDGLALVNSVGAA